MTRFDPIDSDRARNDLHHLWLTCFISAEDRAQILCDAIDNYEDLRDRFLEITQRQFDEYVGTRSQE